MTRLWTALAASALALHTAAPAFAEDIKLRFAGVFPIDHQGTKMMEQVAADVNAAGVGLDMTVYPASQLGSGEALFEDVARGNIDFASAFIYSDTDPRLEFLNMPFLVSSYDDMERVLMDMDSDYNRILQEITAEYGVRVMAANPEGFVGIVATRAPDNWNTFDDKGMNIRVWSSNAVKSTVEIAGLPRHHHGLGRHLPGAAIGHRRWRDLLHQDGDLFDLCQIRCRHAFHRIQLAA